MVALSNTQTNRNVARRKKYTPDEVDYVIAVYQNEYYMIPIKEEHSYI
jgi:hypothetical protein